MDLKFPTYSFLLLIVLTIAAIPVSAEQPDPTSLPVAERQVPDWGEYDALGVRAAAGGTAYNDPSSGLRVLKVTSSTVPGTNTAAWHDYSEGGAFISAQWGDNQHTILVRLNQTPWLGDYQRGGQVTNWREISFSPRPVFDMTGSFSSAPGDERILYVVDNGRLYRFNTETMQTEAESHIPASGLEIPNLHNPLEWIQGSRNHEWIVFQSLEYILGTPINGVVTAFNRFDGTLLQREFDGLNEPHIDRDGRYILIVTDDGWSPCGPDIRYWELWDLDTDTTACKGPIYMGHAAWVRGLTPNGDVNVSAHDNFYFDPSDDSVTVTAQYADDNAFIVRHRATQWIQDDTSPGQWYVGSHPNDGQAWGVEDTDQSPPVESWTQHSGDIYTADVHWWDTYEKPQIGIRAVYQASNSNNDLLLYNLTEVGSIGAMSEGTFFYDGASNPQKIYIWANGGGDPTGRVELFAPTPTHLGIGIRRVDGLDTRFIVHHYTRFSDYRSHPFGTISPDGRVVMFTSNMGLRDGRTDVFLVDMPSEVTQPPGDGVPVTWTELVNASVMDTALSKTGGCEGCLDAGAISEEEISSGDGDLEFIVTETGTLKWIGLTGSHSGTHPDDIDFALRFDSTSWVQVRQNNTYVTDVLYSLGDKFRIAIEGDDVVFYQNDSVFYTIPSPVVSYPLVVDTTLETLGATFDDVLIDSGNTTPPGGTEVIWDNVVNATPDGNSLTKSGGCDGCTDAGGSSQQDFTSGDGYIEFKSATNDALWAAGLSHGDSDTSVTDIDLAFILRAEGYFEIYENGIYRADGGNYIGGDTFRVAINGGEVKYYHNDDLVYTSSAIPTYPVLLDTSLMSMGASIEEAMISAD